ncbi:MAG: M15 family metallopeptidase [Mycobacterium sp.]
MLVIAALTTALAVYWPAPLTSASPAATVTAVTAADLGATWRPECPVAPADLRRVELNYTGFDGQSRRGALVVHRTVVEDVIAIFAELQQLNYPIQRMQTVDHYRGADDELSMQDNNTSAFNCRPLPGSTAWSLHAFGRAIDVNPLINPYLAAGGDLQPATAARYLDRNRDDPGILRADSPAVRVFTDRGWRWGGAWRNPVDYQHFEVG